MTSIKNGGLITLYRTLYIKPGDSVSPTFSDNEYNGEEFFSTNPQVANNFLNIRKISDVRKTGLSDGKSYVLILEISADELSRHNLLLKEQRKRNQVWGRKQWWDYEAGSIIDELEKYTEYSLPLRNFFDQCVLLNLSDNNDDNEKWNKLIKNSAKELKYINKYDGNIGEYDINKINELKKTQDEILWK